MKFRVGVVEDASGEYIIEAPSPEAARRKVYRGAMTAEEISSFRDLGHDNVEIISIEPYDPGYGSQEDRQRRRTI